MKSIAEILDDFAHGRLDRDQAAAGIDGTYFENLGHSTIDHDRLRRTGSAEVVYGEYKTPSRSRRHSRRSSPAVTTRSRRE